MQLAANVTVAIEKRSRDLAKTAVDIWRLDY